MTWRTRAEFSSRFGTFHSGIPPAVGRVEVGRDKALPRKPHSCVSTTITGAFDRDNLTGERWKNNDDLPSVDDHVTHEPPAPVDADERVVMFVLSWG